MSKRKSDDESEILEKLVKKKQILLNSYFGCPSCFNKANNDSKTKKTLFLKGINKDNIYCDSNN